MNIMQQGWHAGGAQEGYARLPEGECRRGESDAGGG